MKISVTQYARQLDTTGRLVIPKKLREEYGMKPGVDYEFYTIKDDEDNLYIGVLIPEPEVNEHLLAEARKLVAKYGLGSLTPEYNKEKN